MVYPSISVHSPSCGPTIELAFGLQPIIKLIAEKAAAFEIDFMCAEPDLFAT
jgi:hypothetical protein